jgi:hypothetical protein
MQIQIHLPMVKHIMLLKYKLPQHYMDKLKRKLPQQCQGLHFLDCKGCQEHGKLEILPLSYQYCCEIHPGQFHCGWLYCQQSCQESSEKIVKN